MKMRYETISKSAIKLTTTKRDDMTAKAEAQLTEKEQEKAALKAREAEIAAKEKEANKDRTGKGTRVFFGMTRGRNPQMIQFENWDDAQPETLPKVYAECIEVLASRGFKGDEVEQQMVRRFVLGDNDILYAEASDPVAEFVEATWPKDVQNGFRMVVRNYASNANVSIEDAVALIKPGIVASEAKKAAAAAEVAKTSEQTASK